MRKHHASEVLQEPLNLGSRWIIGRMSRSYVPLNKGSCLWQFSASLYIRRGPREHELGRIRRHVPRQIEQFLAFLITTLL